MRKVLLIAYHFPPVKVSSGLQRTLSFATDLYKHGWSAEVLTANPRAYVNVSDDQLTDIPEHVNVIRSFAFDTAKLFSAWGGYPNFLALPDRWASWWLGGVFSGLLAIRRSRPDVIWSTYPIATAHLIGLTLHKLTGIPWVADFRDSMTEDDYPSNPRRRKVYKWIERHTIMACSKAIFTTPGAVEMYRSRYPEMPENRWALIPNGYNEEIFSEIEQEPLVQQPRGKHNRILIVHSGLVYPSERDPKPLFIAIANLKKQGLITASALRLVMRATGHDSIFQPMLNELNISDIVELQPGLAYRDALKEMMQANGLLILQARSCNHQIPAKLYEYFRAGRPILALTDKYGDTAKTMRAAGVENISPLDNSDEIADGLMLFIKQIRTGNECIASSVAVANSSRSTAAKLLSDLFKEVC